jgi:hypothetical protein
VSCQGDNFEAFGVHLAVVGGRHRAKFDLRSIVMFEKHPLCRLEIRNNKLIVVYYDAPGAIGIFVSLADLNVAQVPIDKSIVAPSDPKFNCHCDLASARTNVRTDFHGLS